MTNSHVIPLPTECVKKYVDRGNSLHKHAWITLHKIMRRLTKISYIWKY